MKKGYTGKWKKKRENRKLEQYKKELEKLLNEKNYSHARVIAIRVANLLKYDVKDEKEAYKYYDLAINYTIDNEAGMDKSCKVNFYDKIYRMNEIDKAVLYLERSNSESYSKIYHEICRYYILFQNWEESEKYNILYEDAFSIRFGRNPQSGEELLNKKIIDGLKNNDVELLKEPLDFLIADKRQEREPYNIYTKWELEDDLELILRNKLKRLSELNQDSSNIKKSIDAELDRLNIVKDDKPSTHIEIQTRIKIGNIYLYFYQDEKKAFEEYSLAENKMKMERMDSDDLRNMIQILYRLKKPKIAFNYIEELKEHKLCMVYYHLMQFLTLFNRLDDAQKYNELYRTTYHHINGMDPEEHELKYEYILNGILKKDITLLQKGKKLLNPYTDGKLEYRCEDDDFLDLVNNYIDRFSQKKK
jgi:hypothetical protein